MEITLDALISLLGLFVGGGGGAFFMWKYQRKKAKAEAATAEIDAAKDLQDMYQQMLSDAKADREDRKSQMEELRQERDSFKDERNEYREQIDKLTRNVMEWKRLTDETIDDLRMKVARNGRQIEMMRPFMCGDLKCKKRVRVTTLETVESKPADIEPIESEAL